MTPEVKKRIEQIRQGIVPEGYKKTKTDIVPADWKESPIGKYIREYTEKTTIPNQYPVLTSARTGLMLQTDYYSNRQVTTEDNVGYNILPYGYITFRSRSDDGRFRFNENRIIERGVISYFYPVFSFSEEVCHEYMLYLLNFSIYRRMYPYAEGTAQQVLSLKKLGQLKYSLPLVAEQKKIAEILSTQDKAIELQGRKIEELKRFKKGCLEKMFPRKGQKVPEKRFPGFTGDWEQRKLGGVTTSYSGGTPTVGVKEYYDGQIPFIRSAEINSESTELFISEKGLNVSSARLVSKGDILYALYGATSGEVGRARLEGAINQAILAIKPMDNYDAEYLSQWLRKSKQNIVETYLQGGQGNLSGAIVKELIVDFPSYNEQQIIGQYFANLDRLITLHQRKLDEMKKQKKALMQLLLTGIVRVRL
ncbi:MAG: restriction endonuclease subunit S [Clostridiales bacterium]|nr:restriction endonuclease subunit S [Clostridiales bacterium]MBD9173451.1 restriction endonuclease subunit S [Clostridiales bacterium]